FQAEDGIRDLIVTGVQTCALPICTIGRLSLGALVAFNGYLAYLTWPTVALGWTLSIVRRGLTSMTRLEEITGAAAVEAGAVATGLVVAGAVRPALTEGGLREGRPGSDTPVPSVAVTPVVPAVAPPVPFVAVAPRPST